MTCDHNVNCFTDFTFEHPLVNDGKNPIWMGMYCRCGQTKRKWILGVENSHLVWVEVPWDKNETG